MSKLYFILILVIAIVFSACGLKRSNPLDPGANPGIEIPGTPAGLGYTTSGAGADVKFVNLTWDSNSSINTDGYYVYRSLGYFNTFAVVDTVLHIPGAPTQSYVHSSENDPSVMRGDYWYRVSAFKIYQGGRLEGRYSEPLFVRLP
ncbi:MAG TPA: hypothetical protein PKI59_01520 [Candidatus Cloacimonadota bacterium]|jgi:hypothetical protein|nr:hypothetical protein [Candidatus Cloacimonadota bacterium]